MLRLRRQHWRCAQCGWSGYLADDVLGLSGYLSLRVRRLACLSSSDQSFATAALHLKEYCGLSVSGETLRRSCHQDAGRASVWLRTEPVVAETFAEADGEAELQVDAGKVNTTGGWRDLKVASLAKRPLAQAATPAQWQERALPKPTAQVLVSAVEPIEAFMPRLEREVQRLQLDCQPVHCLGDGAEWIWKAAQEVLHQPLQTLDVYHALEHLAQACRGSSTAGGTAGGAASAAADRAAADRAAADRAAADRAAADRAAADTYTRAQTLLLEQGAAGVETFVAQQRAQGGTAEQEQVLQSVTQYFAKQERRLEYKARLREGRPIGSGLIEGHIKTLSLRLKARGARWRVERVANMADLVSLRHSTFWPDYWATAS